MLVAAHKDPFYRITLVDKAWHVRRPRATLDHAFASLEEATAFVLNDSDGAAEFIELVADGTYMVKKLARA
jgi:hypothetical protein